MFSTPSFEPPADRPSTHIPAIHPSEASALRLVDGFEAGRRARAAADAAEIRLLADADASVRPPDAATPEQVRRADLDRRSLIADLATATHVSEWTITRLLSEAADLTSRFTAGVDALARGEISRQHLSVIHDAGHTVVDDANRAEFLEIALNRARELTPGRLAPVLRSVAERFRERTLDERSSEAAATRHAPRRDDGPR
jgi:hypothetical protein